MTKKYKLVGGFYIESGSKNSNCTPFDLKDIDIEETQKYQQFKGFFNITGWIRIYFPNMQYLDFQCAQMISDGAFGWVYQYDTHHYGVGPFSIAIKISKFKDGYKDFLLEEAEIFKKLKNKCKIIRGYPIKVKIDGILQHIIVMNKMDGTLLDFKNNVLSKLSMFVEKQYFIFYIISKLLKIFKCLYDNGLYYTDIKLQNILYQCNNDGYDIALADIGSAAESSGQATLTYPSYFRETGDYNKPTIYDIIYGIAIIYILLSLDEERNFSWRDFYWTVPLKNRSRSDLNRLFQQIITKMLLEMQEVVPKKLNLDSATYLPSQQINMQYKNLLEFIIPNSNPENDSQIFEKLHKIIDDILSEIDIYLTSINK